MSGNTSQPSPEKILCILCIDVNQIQIYPCLTMNRFPATRRKRLFQVSQAPATTTVRITQRENSRSSMELLKRDGTGSPPCTEGTPPIPTCATPTTTASYVSSRADAGRPGRGDHRPSPRSPTARESHNRLASNWNRAPSPDTLPECRNMRESGGARIFAPFERVDLEGNELFDSLVIGLTQT